MSQSFFRSMMEVSRQCRGGLFALITNSPDQQKIGEKAFFASVHPISQSPFLSAFWDDFFQQLTPDQQLPATISFQVDVVEKVCKKVSVIKHGQLLCWAEVMFPTLFISWLSCWDFRSPLWMNAKSFAIHPAFLKLPPSACPLRRLCRSFPATTAPIMSSLPAVTSTITPACPIFLHSSPMPISA